ncbi:origin recognition complex subunit 1 isoform X1 [Entelurus aequoreus]|uniref:origin recognition complex subunit 1 isoform X1 n=2 Tax=Entelurus aequoreus TaxID=161455 RepID=UPI002B1CEE73|nr:origin recognition complex subunit 1 isoform X1 [Entelurus aequoreus]
MKTRLRVRRVYKWKGQPLHFDRKLKNFEYGSLVISVEGLPRPTVITLGQYILIEGEDEDNPYVAKVVKLFGDESEHQMKAAVQWFVRVSEVPVSKLQQLGRDPHPQEIFYYLGKSCDEEINAESILRPVQVKHLDGGAPFPDCGDKDTLYVKLSWDSKRFSMVDPSLISPSRPPARSTRHLDQSPAGTPASRKASKRVLPTPDLAVLRRADSAEQRAKRACVSAGKLGSMEAESLHSATKLSASKCLSAKRRNAYDRTPGVRKRLELSSPEKTSAINDHVLNQILDEALESDLAQSLSASPPLMPRPSHRLTPLAVSLKPTVVVTSKVSSLPSPSRDPTRGTTPRSKEQKTLKEPALGVLPEVDDENSPMLPLGSAQRSSKRKSARLVATRIKKQLNLLDETLTSDDTGDEEEFVPSKKALQSSSEDDDDVIDSDEEILAKKGRFTPRSKKSSVRTPRRTANKKVPGTPQTPRHAAPTMPSRAQPARQPTNILEMARTRLHVSAVPESLPCREQEFQDIYNFVESKIMDGTGGCMYISGVPGTGKTATVHEVIRCLQNAANMDEIPSFHFIEINGMKMTDPHQAYVQILQKLSGQKATADHAASILDKRFSSPAPRKESTVLLVDELDLLWTRKQNVMYNLFDWPTRRHSRLVVLTIANTMDLPERIMINRVASRLGLTRMSFQPYSFKQLQQIITSRLNKVKAFEEDALQLVSRKVAALSGDARRCLDICRRATEICEFSAGPGLVGMRHVMEAVNEMFSSTYVSAIKCASRQEQVFLQAVIAEFRRLGLEEATFQQVFVQHQALCRVEGLPSVSASEGLAACQRLGACRLLLLEGGRAGTLQRVRLNVGQDDVLYALKSD